MEAGFISNPSHLSHIPQHWQPVVEDVRKAYLSYLGNVVHSIWLRGSLPRGLAIDGFSDLDSFALVYSEKTYRWQRAEWTGELETKLKTSYPFFCKLEAMLSSFSETLAVDKPEIAMVIKTQSVCLHGVDIRENLPAFRPSKAMMIYYRWIEEDVHTFLLKTPISEGDVRKMCKRLIRTAFELVMETANEYTTDLYWCCAAFSKFYPEKEQEIFQLLYWYLNPAPEDDNLKPFIRLFGEWTIKSVKKAFKLS